MTRTRESRRERARLRARRRTALGYLIAVIVGGSAGVALDAWIHL